MGYPFIQLYLLISSLISPHFPLSHSYMWSHSSNSSNLGLMWKMYCAQFDSQWPLKFFNFFDISICKHITEKSIVDLYFCISLSIVRKAADQRFLNSQGRAFLNTEKSYISCNWNLHHTDEKHVWQLKDDLFYKSLVFVLAYLFLIGICAKPCTSVHKFIAMAS
jgi:hypothetical protein